MRKRKRKNVKLGLAASCQIEVLVVTCDGCEKSSFETRSLNTLGLDACKRGWLCAKRPAKDLCPACKPARPAVAGLRQAELFS